MFPHLFPETCWSSLPSVYAGHCFTLFFCRRQLSLSVCAPALLVLERLLPVDRQLTGRKQEKEKKVRGAGRKRYVLLPWRATLVSSPVSNFSRSRCRALTCLRAWLYNEFILCLYTLLLLIECCRAVVLLLLCRVV